MKIESEVFSRNDIPAGVYKIVNANGLVLQEQNGSAIWSIWSAQSTQKWNVRYFGPNYDASEGYLISPVSDSNKVLYWDRANGNNIRVAANSTQNTYTRLWATSRSGTNNSFMLSNKHHPGPFIRTQGNSIIVSQGGGDALQFDANLQPDTKASWSYVLTSDPQYPWTDKTDRGEYEAESVKRTRSEELIRSQYNDINDYNNSLSVGSVIMINGDITAYGHNDEWIKMYDGLMPLLNRPYYFGLGNHDIENNQGNTFLDANFSRSLNYMRIQSENKNIIRHDIGKLASQNFSLELPGNLFVLQFNNDPTMEYTTWDKKGIRPNFAWIEMQLNYARQKGYAIIVNVHKPDNWRKGANSYLSGLFSVYDVKVIFAGHYHTSLGRYNSSSYFGDIPVFLSGSASQSTYLITEYDLEKIEIYAVRNNNWRQKIHLSTISLLNKPSRKNPVKFFSKLSSRKALSRMRENSDVVIWESDNGNNQNFFLEQDASKGENVYQIWDFSLNEIIAWNESGHRQVFMHKNEKKDEHFWCFEFQRDNSLIISNYKNRNLVLDVSNSNTNNGTLVQVFEWNNTNAQLFEMYTVLG